MRVLIHDTPENASLWTARHIAAKIKAATDKSVFGLPTGSTPLATYGELIRMHREEGLSFADVVTFNMDEYEGLAVDNAESYHSFMWHNFFDHIDIRPENVNILDGNTPDSEAECRLYEKKIKNAGGIDLFLGGIGEDGHIAFNEPYSSLTSRTRVKTLTHDTVAVNARFFGGDTALVPRRALTVGVGTIMDAREVVILATGARKAEALRHGIEQGVSHKWTVSALQMHPRAIIVCDRAAASGLSSEAVRYFKDIEAGEIEL